ncbi:TetR/AcrR family transcriptional regulator [Paenibacillus sp. NPDC058174]|uniref:TetR/AcrR family transcriptional regulator n=1 Tax=Paenibacillus sp. NPDC058174 TaxID=3346366 RepID=UPI0036D7B70D
MKNTNRVIVSRRGRPAKEPLSRELIIQTAYELLKQYGIDGMSMRKIAKALDTGPASLYVYFQNLEELSSYVFDYGLGSLQLPVDNNDSWREKLIEALTMYFQLLIDQPGLAEISFTTMLRGERYIDLFEYLLAQLLEGGMTPTAAAWGADAILLFVNSHAYEKYSWKKHQVATPADVKEEFKKLNPDRFPLFHRLNEHLFSMKSVNIDRFRWGLEVFLEGIKLNPLE